MRTSIAAVLFLASLAPCCADPAPVIYYAPGENLEHVDVALIDRAEREIDTAAYEFCIKDGKGMSQDQIDDFFKREGEKSAAPFIAEMKPGYKNCWREIDDAKRLGSWTGPPSAEDCIQWAEKLQTKGRAMIDKGLKELMESK